VGYSAISACAVNTGPEVHQQSVSLIFGVCDTSEGFDSTTVKDDTNVVTCFFELQRYSQTAVHAGSVSGERFINKHRYFVRDDISLGFRQVCLHHSPAYTDLSVIVNFLPRNLLATIKFLQEEGHKTLEQHPQPITMEEL